jgi:hypothetical protein
MMLIPTDTGYYVNAAMVEKWRPITAAAKPGETPPPGQWALLNDKGQSLGNTAMQPELFGWPIVPAYPGFRVLHLVDEAGQQSYVEEHQIIAWRIPAQGALVPITLAGIAVSSVIASPTDRIVAPDGSAFANQAAWFASMRR